MIQAAILILSGLAVWLTNGKHPNRWGPIIGILAQPIWLIETVRAGQWGMFLLSFWFLAAYVRGAWYLWHKPKPFQISINCDADHLLQGLHRSRTIFESLTRKTDVCLLMPASIRTCSRGTKHCISPHTVKRSYHDVH